METVLKTKKAVEVALAVSERWGMKYSLTGASELQDLVQDIEEKNIRLALIGDFSSGKSSLLNALLGRDLLPVQLEETTKTWFHIYPDSVEDNEYLRLPDGSTLPLGNISEVNLETNQKVDVHINTDIIPPNYHFMDTPGLSSAITQHLDIAAEALSRADALILVIDAKQPITERALSFLKASNYLSLVTYVLLNKAELIENNADRQKLLDHNLAACSALNPRKGILTSTYGEPGIVEFQNLILNEIPIDAESIKTIASIARAEKLCSSLKQKLYEYRKTISLDLGEIDENLRELRSQRERIALEMEMSISKYKREVQKSIRTAIDNFHRKGMELVDAKIDAIVKSSDAYLFTSALENAWEHEGDKLAQIIQSKLENLQADFTVSIGDTRINRPLFIDYISWASMILLILVPTPAGAVIEGLLGKLLGEEISKKLTRSFYLRALRASVDQYSSSIRRHLDERADQITQDIKSIVKDQTMPSLVEKEDLITSFMEKRQNQAISVEEERADVDQHIGLLDEALIALNE